MVDLRGVENDRYGLWSLFRYSPISRRLEPTGDRPSGTAKPAAIGRLRR
jgi:hypothetical protein